LGISWYYVHGFTCNEDYKKGLVNSIVNGPGGKRLRLTWSDLVKVF
jgi:hypothetical protein